MDVSVRAIGIHEIYYMTLRYSPEAVANYLREYAESPVTSLHLLDDVLEIKEQYAEDLAAGKAFSICLNRYMDARYAQLLKPGRPSAVKRVRNFSKAIFKFVVEGMPLEGRDEATRRYKICEANECGNFDGSVCQHMDCGCFTKIKTFFTTEHCPVGKW